MLLRIYTAWSADLLLSLFITITCRKKWKIWSSSQCTFLTSSVASSFCYETSLNYRRPLRYDTEIDININININVNININININVNSNSNINTNHLDIFRLKAETSKIQYWLSA